MRWFLLFCLLVGLASCAWTQEAPEGGASPPSGSSGAPSGSVNNPAAGETPTADQMQPDTHPLAGAYLFTLGSALEDHSYFEPAFSIGEAGETNASFAVNGRQAVTLATVPAADLTLSHVSPRNQLSLSYLGGGFIYDNGGAPDGSFHTLNISDRLMFRRWTLNLTDFFSYLPQASLGFGGVGVFGGLSSGNFSGSGFSTGTGQINPMYGGGTSILASQYSAYNNTALAQATYVASARTSVVVVASWGTIQSGGGNKTGFISANDVFGMIGVNRALTARDTVGVNYSYGTFHYIGLAESFNSQTILGSYGRKITGRLALQLYGGPEFVTYRSAPGSVGVLAPGQNVASPSTVNETYFSGTGGLSYAQRRNTFSLFVGRYAQAGSGILAGSENTELTASWSRRVTRKWSSQVYGGYARSTVLAPLSVTPNVHYGYAYGDLTLTRPLSRRVNLTMGYEYERQVTNSTGCTTRVCATNFSQQIFGIGLTFTPRPMGL